MVRSFIPGTYEEALGLLDENKMILMAGGTDLMVKKRNWAGLSPLFDRDVLFISELAELKYIRKSGGFLHIGSMTTLEDILVHKQIPEILKVAVRLMASPGIRHIATIGGNIGNASPAGDSLPVLYILDAKIVIDGKGTERMVPIEEFIVGPGKTVLADREMIKEIVINDVRFDKLHYCKIGGRKSDAISKVSFAGGISYRKGRIEEFRCAFGAVAPTVVRSRSLEASMKGLGTEGIESVRNEVKHGYNELIRPIDDQRSTAVYRKKVCMNILDEFFDKAGDSK
ncbi:MAG TPA: FAD binding domain-containing protein [Clostridia bacterium]|nr:FAD binding domain-containing protein [Clostridia bacterium]HPQ45924.1 FAD binding domain-containing protein [Clostridia bacterium]